MDLRTHQSYISKERVEEYREASDSVEPCNTRLTDLSTDELLNEGIELLKEDGFKLADEDLRNL
ncbi:MAG: hypothetical protein E7359_00810 [Clostridiales bacterium]|nr:hypothetical protein [Clostridiales bacterium]